MRKTDFMLIPLCVFLVIVNVTGSIWARIALAVTALIVLFNVVREVISYAGNKKEDLPQRHK